MSERTCVNCRAFCVVATDGSDGECRLRAPAAYTFPRMSLDDWCLEWVSKEKTPAVPQGATSRKTVYPSDFVPNERAEAMAKAQGQNIHALVAEWRDHHKAKGSLMADWQASLMTWLRNDVKFKEGRR